MQAKRRTPQSKRQQKKLKEEFIMAISAKQVKELRDMTGAGMMDCKKALT